MKSQWKRTLKRRSLNAPHAEGLSLDQFAAPSGLLLRAEVHPISITWALAAHTLVCLRQAGRLPQA